MHWLTFWMYTSWFYWAGYWCVISQFVGWLIQIWWCILLLPDCLFHRYLYENAITLVPVGMVDNNPGLKYLCVSLDLISSKDGWIPILYFRQSKTANHIIPLQRSLHWLTFFNVHLMISVCWVLMCWFAVCGLADTDLMVHIVASRLLISQILARQRHHFDPGRTFEQQPST